MSLLTQRILNQGLESARESSDQLPRVGVRYFQPERTESAGKAGSGFEYRGQPVPLWQFG